MTANMKTNKPQKNGKIKWIIFIIYLVCLSALFVLSFVFDIGWGKESAKYFGINFWEMIQIVPAAFVLIALFDQWVKREYVVKQLGQTSGLKGYVWALILAGVSVGGVYVMFPLAASLRKKGASFSARFNARSQDCKALR